MAQLLVGFSPASLSQSFSCSLDGLKRFMLLHKRAQSSYRSGCASLVVDIKSETSVQKLAPR